jgi:hypothetical protein
MGTSGDAFSFSAVGTSGTVLSSFTMQRAADESMGEREYVR